MSLNSDVISTITPVESPIISSVGDNVHINAMGADAHRKQEFDNAVTSSPRAEIFVDDIEQVLHSGEVSQP